ncbi:peptidoglycan-binding protein [Candidatus Parcubacteria bacterium]|nr:peptidoglycan-binding protein [Candidatus Parcubacteria bacterium]
MSYKNIKKKYRKFPAFSQWKQVFKVLNKNEKIILCSFFILTFTSSIFLIFNFYIQNTQTQPADGGIYREGVVGRPRFINPVYSAANDVDRDLTELIFSGLMKYDREGKIVPDLVRDYKIDEQGTIYEFYLKDNILWHDGKKLTAEDVVFTIKTIQNPDYKSPLWINWLGIKVEKTSELVVRFTLKKPYPGFLETATVKIMPKHIWENISPQNFPLTDYNFQPIGTGPYKLKNIERDKLGVSFLILEKNPDYFNKKPFISEISFRFFEEEKDLTQAAARKEIDGFSILNFKNYNTATNQDFADYHFSLPRYFAVFFNQSQCKILSEKEVREGLAYGTNKQEIINKALSDHGKIVNSPILPNIYGFSPPQDSKQFNIEKAKQILEDAGFKEREDGIREKTTEKKPSFEFKSRLQTGSRGDEARELQKCLSQDAEVYPEGEISGYFGSKTKQAVIKFQEKYSEEILEPFGLKNGTGIVGKSTRAKLNELCAAPKVEILPLQFTLTTVNQPQLLEVAEVLKQQWKKIGVEIQIESWEPSELSQDILKPRNYQALLFGEVLGSIIDPFPFWHSSQKQAPGLNLTMYENEKVDKLLEEARQSTDEKIRKEKYEEFQALIIEEIPAIFLYTPDFLYFVNEKIKGVEQSIIVDPSKRFSGIENWYIKTHRVWKK